MDEMRKKENEIAKLKRVLQVIRDCVEGDAIKGAKSRQDGVDRGGD